jgi:hypothetical protein
MTKINDALLVSGVTDAIQMPTGEAGDKAISVGQIKAYVKPPRATLNVALGTIPNNQTVTGSFAVTAGYLLRSITTSASMRVRLYPSSAARDADLLRPLGMDYVQGSAQLLEFHSVNGLLSAVLSPAVNGYSTDGNCYYSVRNLSLADATMTMSFDYLPTEV